MTEETQSEGPQPAQLGDGSEWYRSPLVLLAALILFAGALTLIVVSVGDGGDASGPADRVGSATIALGEDIVAPPPVFGGEGALEVASVAVIGEVLPQLGEGDDPAIGAPAPAVRASSLGNGAEITLESGRARVIGLFAHWCEQCKAELPEVASWLRENRLPANAEFIAISTAASVERDNYPPSAWLAREAWPSPVIVDDADGTLLAAYGFVDLPSFIAIDASGVVIARSSGPVGAAGVAALFDQFAGAPRD